MSDIEIVVVKTVNQWLQCQQVRSSAFLGTEPYHEEFDDNDLEMVTHILALSGEDPVACMRLRCIQSDTIHWGRLAILPNMPGKDRVKTLLSITSFVEAYSSSMKFKRIIGEVSDERLMSFWRKRGFTLTGGSPVVFGKREYWPFEKYPNYAQLS